MKTRSSYDKRLARRKSAGLIHYRLPVDSKGRATLNNRDFVRDKDGGRKTREFTRLARADEV